MIGIYCIKNTANNKVYIGSSNNITRRFKRHRTELKTKTHSNKYLEKAYNKYGKEKFDFIVLEDCSEDKLLERELFYIQKYNSLKKEYGYNLKLPIPHPTIVCSTDYSAILSKAKKGITPSNFIDMQKTRWKQIEVYKDDNLLSVFNSLRETEREMGINRGNVYNYLKGITKAIRNFENYHFKYKE